MSSSRLYTNTGKLGSIAGLVVTTVLVTYAAQNANQIVNGTIAFGKEVVRSAKRRIEIAGTKEVPIYSRDINGEVYDTGMKARVKK